MTRNEGIALIKQQLQGRTTLDGDIVNYLKLAQTTLESGPTKPWFLVSEESFTTTTADEERIAVPSTFLAEVDDAVLKYRPSTWPDDPEVDLLKDEYDKLRLAYREAEAGEPEAYALLGEYFRFFPLPDDAYTIRLIFYAQDTVLDSNIENKWLKHAPLLLLGSAGQLMGAGPLRDGGGKSVFDGWIATGLKLLHSMDTDRELRNRVLQMGGRSV